MRWAGILRPARPLGSERSPSQLSASFIRSAMSERVSLDELVEVGEPVGVFSWVRPWMAKPRGRRCTNCGEVKPFGEFRPNLRLSSGWNSWCRACCVERNRRWRAEHPEQQQAYNERRRVPPVERACVECGGSFEGPKNRLLCSRRCKDRRYARSHPEKLRAKQRRKDARRRARLKAGR